MKKSEWLEVKLWPKFVENIVQAVSRDILCHAMQTLSHCFICGHVHDELIIECGKDVSLDVICGQMGMRRNYKKRTNVKDTHKSECLHCPYGENTS